MQLKSKSDKTKKSKGLLYFMIFIFDWRFIGGTELLCWTVSKSRKSPAKDLSSRGCAGENSSKRNGDSSVSESKGSSITTVASSPQLDYVAVETASKKRQKLHWGYISNFSFENEYIKLWFKKRDLFTLDDRIS